MKTGLIEPRGLSRGEAALYVGLGTTKFDELVASRRMPRPRRVDGRVIWDRFELDRAFADLPYDIDVVKTPAQIALEKSRQR